MDKLETLDIPELIRGELQSKSTLSTTRFIEIINRSLKMYNLFPGTIEDVAKELLHWWTDFIGQARYDKFHNYYESEDRYHILYWLNTLPATITYLYFLDEQFDVDVSSKHYKSAKLDMRNRMNALKTQLESKILEFSEWGKLVLPVDFSSRIMHETSIKQVSYDICFKFFYR